MKVAAFFCMSLYIFCGLERHGVGLVRFFFYVGHQYLQACINCLRHFNCIFSSILNILHHSLCTKGILEYECCYAHFFGITHSAAPICISRQGIETFPYPSLIYQLPQSVIQGVQLALFRNTAPSPPYPTLMIQQIYISDFAIHHPDLLPQAIRQRLLPHEEIPFMLLLWHVFSHPPHKQTYQPRLQHIIFKVDLDPLCLLGCIF